MRERPSRLRSVQDLQTSKGGLGWPTNRNRLPTIRLLRCPRRPRSLLRQSTTRRSNAPVPLKMRQTALSSGYYRNTVDYSVFCGEWCIGRIYENRSGPESLRWFWALYAPSKPGDMRISNQVATLEGALR
jgi:hypothetical protein